MMVQVLGFLLLKWDTQAEFLHPCFSIIQVQAIVNIWEVTHFT